MRSVKPSYLPRRCLGHVIKKKQEDLKVLTKERSQQRFKALVSKAAKQSLKTDNYVGVSVVDETNFSAKDLITKWKAQLDFSDSEWAPWSIIERLKAKNSKKNYLV